MMAGALLFGFLPSPLWPMYFAPVAPLLACLVALLHARNRAAGGHRLMPVAVLVAMLLCLPVLGQRLQALAKLAVAAQWVGLTAQRHAAEIRDAILAQGVPGDVATLYPTHVLDANPLRPGFAAGPFFFRTADLLPPERIRRLRGIGAAGLEEAFAADPPAAILGGFYPDRWRALMDAPVLEYAARQVDHAVLSLVR
jgi:hypothetical protein